MSDEKPDYKVYRSRPRWLGGRKEQDGLSELRGTQPASAPPAPGRAADRPDYVLVLPWNLRAELTEQLSYVRGWGGRLVFPIPTLEVV